MASITPRKLRSGAVTWRVQFRIDGAMKEENFGDIESATAFGELVDRVGGAAARKVRDARAMEGRASAHLTLTAWTARYLDPENGMLGGIGEGTVRDYGRMAKRSFLVVLGEMPVDAITKDDVGKWIRWQERQVSARGLPMAAKTVTNYQGLLSSVLSATTQRGLAPENVARGAKITRGMPRESVFLSHREFGVLLASTPQFYRPLILFLATTGARWGEATAAEWGDLNFETEPVTWSVRRAWKKDANGRQILGPPKTPRSRREIPLDVATVTALGKPGPPGQRIFIGPLSAERVYHGRFLTSTWNPSVARARNATTCAALGLAPIAPLPRPHDLRHTMASWGIAAGMSLVEIQRRLGHESITTTVDRYGHLAPEQAAAAAKVFGAIAEKVFGNSGGAMGKPKPDIQLSLAADGSQAGHPL